MYLAYGCVYLIFIFVVTFSEILGSLVTPDSVGEGSHCPNELIIDHLRSLAKQAKEKGSMTLMETTLITLGSIAK